MVTRTTSGMTASRMHGQQRAELEHREDDEAQHQQIAENGDQAGGEQVVQHVHVGGDARDQAAHGIAVVESDVELLQVRHQLPAQVEHGLLADALHQVHLPEFEHEDPRPARPGRAVRSVRCRSRDRRAGNGSSVSGDARRVGSR